MISGREMPLIFTKLDIINELFQDKKWDAQTQVQGFVQITTYKFLICVNKDQNIYSIGNHTSINIINTFDGKYNFS